MNLHHIWNKNGNAKTLLVLAIDMVAEQYGEERMIQTLHSIVDVRKQRGAMFGAARKDDQGDTVMQGMPYDDWGEKESNGDDEIV